MKITEIAENESIFWSGKINQESLREISGQIIKMTKETEQLIKETELYLYLYSTGGNYTAAFAFFDMVPMMTKGRGLNVIACGRVDSAAVVVLAAGKKRLITPNTQMLIHEMGFIYENGRRFSLKEAREMYKELERDSEIYAKIIASRTGVN